MCRILNSRTVKTRKSHKCFGCRKEIKSGTLVTKINVVDMGKISSDYWCKVCEEVVQRDSEHGDMFPEGSVYDGDPERWHEVEKELAEQEERR